MVDNLGTIGGLLGVAVEFRALRRFGKFVVSSS